MISGSLCDTRAGLLLMLCTLLLVATAPLASAQITEGYAESYASPSRRIGAYVVQASSSYNPNTLPTSIYVFRKTASLSGDVIPNQVDIIEEGGDVRQYVVVVVPSGSLPTPIVTLAQLQALNGTYQFVTIGGQYCHCPLLSQNFTYNLAVDKTLYPVQSAQLANGSSVFYIFFGVVDTFASSNVYAIRTTTNNTLLTYLVDTIPGDTGYTAMRKIIEVKSDTVITNTASLASLAQVDTMTYISFAVVYVLGVDASAETFQAATGYSDTKQVRYYDFNATRLTTSVASQTGIVPAKLYFIAGQSTPVIDVVPGDAAYSDLWSVYDLTIPNVTLPVTTLIGVSTAGAVYRGEYWNCPVVNGNSTLSNGTDEAGTSKLALYFRGDTRYCMRFPDFPAMTCSLNKAYELIRAGTGLVVEGNDLFTYAPSMELFYSPMTWVLPLTVNTQFPIGSVTSVSAMPGTADVVQSTGRFSNRPILYEVATTAKTYNASTTLGTLAYKQFLVEWTLNSDSLDIRVTSMFSDGYIAVGFGGDSAAAHAGYFVMGYEAANGQSCSRQFFGSGAGPATVSEQFGNLVNATNVVYQRNLNNATLSFTRSIVATEATGVDNATLITTELTKISAVSVRTKPATCFAELSTLTHDKGASSLVLWDTTLSSSINATTPAPDFWQLTPSPGATANTSAPSYNYTGTYRCDPLMTFSWVIDPTTSVIEFTITTRSTFTGWVGIGIGDQMIGADIITAYQHPTTGAIVVDDRKGIVNELPPRDAQQDVLDASIPTTGTFTFSRKLDTGDRLTSAQPLTRATLSATSYAALSGWAGGTAAAYYNFGNLPTFGGQNSTSTAKMYVMRNATSGSSLEFQRDLVDVVPGQVGYSDLWTVVDVEVPSDFIGPEIKYVNDIPASWVKGELSTLWNCPVMDRSSSINLVASSAVSRTIWYRGLQLQCFLFADQNSQSTSTQKVYFLRDQATNRTIDTVFQKKLTDADFTPFAWVYYVSVPSTYPIGSYTSEAALLSSPYTPVEQGIHLNLPTVSVALVSPSGQTPTPAPPTLDQALFDQYANSMPLNNDTTKQVMMYWNYLPAQRILQVMVVAYNARGYVALGFSNTTSEQMQFSDIVMGFVDTNGTGCVRTLYSEAKYGSPWNPPSLQIRSQTVQSLAGAVVLRFERDFDGMAHFAGLIPTPAQGAQSRVIYATTLSQQTDACDFQSFQNLYHGTSPHGSVTVNWQESVLANSTSSPVATPAPPFVLTQETIAATSMYMRGTLLSWYCAPSPLTILTTISTFSTPVMYQFATNGVIDNSFAYVIETYPTSADYTGVWDVRVLELQAGVTTNLTSAAQVLLLNLTTVSTYMFNCPVVHPSTQVAGGEFTNRPVYFQGQQLGCMDFGNVSSNALGIQWNVSTAASSNNIVDDANEPIRRLLNVNGLSASITYNDAAMVSSLTQIQSTTVRNCVKIPNQVAEQGSFAVPVAAAYSTLTGYFNGRQVTYFQLKSATRFADKDSITVNDIYILKNGSSISSPDAQSSFVASVGPGNLTYSDVWRVVIVDVGTVFVNTSLQNVASLASFTKTTTSIYLNCPVINPSTSFSGATVQLESLYYENTALSCANFGLTESVPSQLPDVYQVQRSGGVLLTSAVFSSVPGVEGYFPVQWLRTAKLTTDVTNDITSVEALELLQHAKRDSYEVWNVYVVAVAQGARVTALGEMKVDGTLVYRADSSALMASPLQTNFTAFDTSSSIGPAVPSLSTIYIFRRGTEVESEEVDNQRPLIDVAPGQVSYTASAGSAGYSDTQIVYVVMVPRNYTGSEIRMTSSLTTAIAGSGFVLNSSTGYLMHAFVNVNTTLDTTSEISCPTTSVWFNSQPQNTLNCGFSRQTATAAVSNPTTSGLVVATTRSGVSLRTVVPLTASNPFVVNAFKPVTITAWSNNRAAVAYRLTAPNPITTPIAKKYVFRNGPSLTSGDGVDILVPVLSSSVSTQHLVELIVVDVSYSIERSNLPTSIVGEDEMLANAETLCWPIRKTGLYQAGSVIAEQTSVPTIIGATVSSAYSGGIKYTHIVSSTISEAEKNDTDNYVVLVSLSDGTQQYVFPDAVTPTQSSLRYVRTYNSTSNESIRTMPANVNTSTDVVVMHLVSVASKEYVTPPTQATLARQSGWYSERRVFYYEFADRNVSSSAVNTPSPIYIFRQLDSTGRVGGTLGTALIVSLPGHSDYNDVHATYYADVPATSTSRLPETEAELSEQVSNGEVNQPVFSGTVSLMPVLNTATTIDSRDYYNPATNTKGASALTVKYEREEYLVLDFGSVPSSFDSSRETAVEVSVDGTLLSDNTVFNSIPRVYSTVGNDAYNPLKEVFVAALPTTYTLNSETNYSGIVTLAGGVLTSTGIRAFAVVAVDSEVSTDQYDDTTIEAGAMKVVWAYGELASYPLEFKIHENNGVAEVDFFTGATDESSNNNARVTSSNSIQFGNGFSMSWYLRRIGSNSRRRFATLDTITYAPEEVEIVITIDAVLDVWAGLGITQTGGMSGADIWIAYGTEYLPTGGAVDVPYYRLQDRKASADYSIPALDTIQDLSLIGWEKKSLADGFTMTYFRRLVTDDSNDYAIPNAEIDLVWAYGQWDRSANAPKQHTAQGVMKVNLVTGKTVPVPQRADSYWYIAVLVAVICFVMLLSLCFRTMPPGTVLHRRPFKSKAAESHGWLTYQSVGELFVVLCMLAMAAMWMVGVFQDLDHNRQENAAWKCIGAGAQFFLYFYLIPTSRNNLILKIFKTYFHRVYYWANMAGVLMTILAWVHGFAHMIIDTTAAFKWQGVAGLLATISMTLLVINNSGLLPIPRRLVNIFYWLLVLMVIIFTCIHVPETAYGMIPSFILLLWDFIVRFKDRNSRHGSVRSFASFGDKAVAMEVQVWSPWHKCRTRPFTVVPGMFVYAHFTETREPIPLMISSRVLQDIESDWCTFTLHVKASHGADVATELMAAAKAGKLAGRKMLIEGPYGGSQLRLKFYHTLVLVAGGIGMTSVMSLLESLTYDADYYSRSTQIQNVILIWVAESPQDMLVFATELVEMMKAPRPFQLEVKLYASGLMPFNPIQTNMPDFVEAEDGTVSGPPQKYQENRVMEFPDHPLFSQVDIKRGRPPWMKVMSDIKIAALTRNEFRAAVYVSGPKSLNADASSACDQLSDWKEFQYHVERESYLLR